MTTILPQQWQRLSQLLDTALELGSEEREAWLSRLTLEEGSLIQPLRALLAQHARFETREFVCRPPDVAGALLAQQELLEGGGRDLQPGTMVGPYRLVSEIGRGGMSVVWSADRVDGAFNRRVALKLPHATWAMTLLKERMARERDILAALEHPNIARFYDAGVDDSGRPYMVMELVEGQPIDQYCRDRHLPIDACLRLVLDVARAVAYAHAKLVVHRDLKPGNLLVTAEGAVRLLDFGIAKLVQGDESRDSPPTRVSGRVLTPEYASPEQIKGAAVSTATDVYSLAVVCFELLTGSRPYRLRSGASAELEQAIIHVEPLLASASAFDPLRRRQLRGDVDAILNKALKKDPLERYATVDAFASDVERYLRRLPVLARPDGTAYRLRRFVARNKMGTAAVVAVAVTLIAGAAVASWQARVARDEARRADDISAFILSLFKNARPSAGGAAELRVVDLLSQSLQRIERDLADQPRRQLDLYLSVGDSLSELNAYREGVKAYDNALDRAKQLRMPDSEAAVAALIGKAEALVALDDLKSAASLLNQVEEIQKTGPADALRARTWMARSYLKLNEREPEQAVKLASAGVELLGRLLGTRDIEYLKAVQGLARAQYHADQCDRAMPGIDHALRELPIAFGVSEHPDIMTMRGIRARCLKDLRRYRESRVEFERNDPAVRATYGERSKDYAIELAEHGDVERSLGNSAVALDLATRSLEILEENGIHGYSVVGVNAARVLALIQGRYLDGAESAIRRYRDVGVETFGPDDREVLVSNIYLALVRGLQGDLPQAVKRLESLIRDMPLNGESYRARSQSLVAWLRLLNGDARGTLPQLAECIPLLEARGAADATWLANARSYYGIAQMESGQLSRARDSLESALRQHESLYPVATPDRADIWVALARVHLQLQDVELALMFAQRANEFWMKHDAASRWAGEASYWHGRALLASGRRDASVLAFSRAIALLSGSPFPVDKPLVADATRRGSGL